MTDKVMYATPENNVEVHGADDRGHFATCRFSTKTGRSSAWCRSATWSKEAICEQQFID